MNSQFPTKRLGLIGYPLSHSFSRTYFENKFRSENIEGYSYDNFEIPDIEVLPDLISGHDGLIGLNVTIPYKKSVIRYLHSLDPVAREIGAVNTIKIDRAGDKMILTGYNTDVPGFMISLEGFLGTSRPSALVFGSGGASSAVRFVLEKLGIHYLVVSRKQVPGQLTYADLNVHLIMGHRLLVNCTPLGTYPDIGECIPIPYDGISAGHYLYDLVYNPSRTVFLAKGLERGARIMNGHEMLIRQAEEAWKIWTKDS
jgi:shikimate dehydrogenase